MGATVTPVDGVEGACQLVRDSLAELLPARLAAITTRLALPQALPVPALVAAEERGPLGIEWLPAVYALPGRLEQLTYLDSLPGGVEVYRARYALTVLTWVHAQDYPSTADLAKRYALAVRESLLARKGLTDPGSLRAGEFTVDPSSIVEDYSPALTDEASRSIAGVETSVSVSVVETLDTTAPVGTAEHIHVAVSTLPWID